MNLTILSLISTSLLSHSPAYVGNHIEAKNCHFQKYFSEVFFNQESLLVQWSKFQFILGGVIRKEHAIYSETITDPIYETYITITWEGEEKNNYNEFNKGTHKTSYSILNCLFRNIQFNEYILKFNTDVSLYISDTTICDSTGQKNPIFLNSNRCNTLSHICCTGVEVTNAGGDGTSFLLSKAERGDFFILVYSTVVGKMNDKQIGHTINFNSGRHYHRCNNYTNHKLENSVMGMEACFCFSCSMMTISNIKGRLFKISGTLSEFSSKTDIKHVVFNQLSCYDLDKNNQDGLIRLEVKDEPNFEVYLNNCVFKAIYNNLYLFSIGGNGETTTFTFNVNNCVIDNRINKIITDGNYQYNINDGDSTYADANIITPILIAHYTNQYCIGQDHPDKKELAKGCNVDNCLDDSNCNETIGFPSNAAPYKTKFYPDLQTPTPTPTNEFSQSIMFSDSGSFTNSVQFTSSNHYTPSIFFSFSKEFSKSSAFSETKKFTKSEKFSFSSKFTKSQMFSQSISFSNSMDFTYSKFFSFSKEFSKSSAFSETKKFTKSEKFSFSSKFTKSQMFSQSISFSNSIDFTYSKFFSFSKEFSKTGKFSSSSKFSSSHSFTPSNEFPVTDTFTPSNSFTASTKFTKSTAFSESNKFEPSTKFTNSNKFTKSITFTESKSFSHSSLFTKSSVFSDSFTFPHFHPPETTPQKTPTVSPKKTESASESPSQSLPSPSKTLPSPSLIVETGTFTDSSFHNLIESFLDDSESDSKNTSCKPKLYLIYTLLAVAVILIIIVIILSILLCKRKMDQNHVFEDYVV